MHSRAIHPLNGNDYDIRYGTSNQAWSHLHSVLFCLRINQSRLTHQLLLFSLSLSLSLSLAPSISFSSPYFVPRPFLRSIVAAWTSSFFLVVISLPNTACLPTSPKHTAYVPSMFIAFSLYPFPNYPSFHTHKLAFFHNRSISTSFSLSFSFSFSLSHEHTLSLSQSLYLTLPQDDVVQECKRSYVDVGYMGAGENPDWCTRATHTLNRRGVWEWEREGEKKREKLYTHEIDVCERERERE